MPLTRLITAWKLTTASGDVDVADAGHVHVDHAADAVDVPGSSADTGEDKLVDA